MSACQYKPSNNFSLPPGNKKNLPLKQEVLLFFKVRDCFLRQRKEKSGILDHDLAFNVDYLDPNQ